MGKSTAFSALTEMPVDIANYPFTTIEPNVGSLGYRFQALVLFRLRERRESSGRLDPSGPDDDRKGSICSPNTGSCSGFKRLVPVTLVDVAGLVRSSRGKGQGEPIPLRSLRCDALIQVVDVSGTTDLEGNPVGSGARSRLKSIASSCPSWTRGLWA